MHAEGWWPMFRVQTSCTPYLPGAIIALVDNGLGYGMNPGGQKGVGLGIRIRVIAAVSLLGWGAALAGQPQIRVTRVERMPNIPQPFHVRDWRKVARGFDRLAFDLKAAGEHLPLVWLVLRPQRGQAGLHGHRRAVGRA